MQAAGSKEQRQTGVDILQVFWDASILLSWIGSGVHFLCFLSSKPFGHHHRLSNSFFVCLHVWVLVALGVCDLYMDCTIHSDLRRVKK